ncbi:RNA:NAD 2'-phosphotransferase [Nostoc flagelliforme CCNUN1]|uniref:RNA:NAD 2'-phosphotransferase n=1 Tax=Nostoc flagelliforme CCNUN1 TaxID=2038116 RepID=A0A2K8T4W9_9NOSO|nr:RNA:NAD 2'-phosphotransferase [Nostoc flagelliforme CCNUN1]
MYFQAEQLSSIGSGAVESAVRANASKLYLLTTEVKNQRKISISRLIYFHRFKAIA